MRKWMGLSGVALALVFGVAPGAVGIWLERALDDAATRIETQLGDSPYRVVDPHVAAKIKRGWFQTHAAWDLAFTVDTPQADQPRQSYHVLIEAPLRHGPVLFGGMPGFGLARTDFSQMSITIPGLALNPEQKTTLKQSLTPFLQNIRFSGYNDIGFTGGVTSHLRSKPAKFALEDGEVDWGGLSFDGTMSVAGSAQGSGNIGKSGLVAPTGKGRFGPTHFDFALQTIGNFWLTIGHSTMVIDDIEVTGGNGNIRMTNASLASDTRLDDQGRIASSIDHRIKTLEMAGVTTSDLRFAFGISNIDTDAYIKLVTHFQGDDAEIGQDEIKALVHDLLASKPHFAIEEIGFSTPEGRSQMRLDAESLYDGSFDIADRQAQIRAIDANATITIAPGHAKQAARRYMIQQFGAGTPEGIDMDALGQNVLDQFVARGVLRRAGADYVSNWTLKNGILAAFDQPMVDLSSSGSKP